MSNETITISIAEYKELKKDAEFLRALEAAGVDNWKGYRYAYDVYEKRKNYEE